MQHTQDILPGRSLEEFLAREGAAWKPDTRASYRRALQDLQRYTADHGPPTVERLEAWRRQLQAGYSQRSVNQRISAANHYFRWCGRPDLLMRHERTQQAPPPELTRSEYLRLLRAARSQSQRQLYLLVKLFAVTGLPLQCLGQVTAEVVQAGGGVLPCRGQPFALRLPAGLQRELLDYLNSQGITTGPVFLSRSGRLLNRSYLCRCIQELCRAAGVPVEKGNPRCLRDLWRRTQNELYAKLEQQVDQVYSLLLQAEEETAGWPAGA